jgi:hypothetical protein
MKQLTDSDFSEKYNAFANHIDSKAGFCGYNEQDEDAGCLFETYGEELDFVFQAHLNKPKNVWTIIEGDDDNMYICAGFHYVNRIGFFITEQEWLNETEEYLCD